MKKLSLLSLGLAFAACSSPGAGSQSGRLAANSDAQHVGVYAYAVDRDTVTLYDQYGLELGLVRAVDDGSDRIFRIEQVNGETDQVEVYRPLPDGSFVAPITPETLLSATLADPAVASVWASHQVRFTLNVERRYVANGELAPQDSASTTACSSYSCTGSGCTPLGCAKPANTSVGCTNPSQLPATVTYDNRAWHTTGVSGMTLDDCLYGSGPAFCADVFGGANKDYTVDAGSITCVVVPADGNTYKANCKTGTSGNRWYASCPENGQHCTVAGEYDAVPRQGDCNNPGSCTYSQGTVVCTTYH